jgi:hypothetical protein
MEGVGKEREAERRYKGEVQVDVGAIQIYEKGKGRRKNDPCRGICKNARVSKVTGRTTNNK